MAAETVLISTEVKALDKEFKGTVILGAMGPGVGSGALGDWLVGRSLVEFVLRLWVTLSSVISGVVTITGFGVRDNLLLGTMTLRLRLTPRATIIKSGALVAIAAIVRHRVVVAMSSIVLAHSIYFVVFN